MVKGPAADATDAPQPWGLLWNPVMKITMMIIFCPFPSNGAPVEWNWQGKTEELGEKPVLLPLCPPQIPHWLTWDRTRASAVGGRRLTAWAMARPQANSVCTAMSAFFIWLQFAVCALNPHFSGCAETIETGSIPGLFFVSVTCSFGFFFNYCVLVCESLFRYVARFTFVLFKTQFFAHLLQAFWMSKHFLTGLSLNVLLLLFTFPLFLLTV
jgi:hypothetical protein